jgi:hypothetical protein
MADPRERSRDVDITPEMLRAGVTAFLNWSYENEEPECLVAEIFFAMTKAAHGPLSIIGVPR